MLFKITVLGDGGVGKTAITVQVSFALAPLPFERKKKNELTAEE